MKRILVATLLAFVISGATAKKTGNEFSERIAEYAHALTDKAPTSPLIETAFSPEAGAERLVVKVINSSERSIRLAAYPCYCDTDATELNLLPMLLDHIYEPVPL